MAVMLSLGAIVCGCSLGKKTAIAEMGPETWQIGNRTYQVASTHYERGPHDSVFYVVGYPLPDDRELFGINEETARTLAWPLMLYAYESRSYERTVIRPLRGMIPPMVRIAVDLLPSRDHRDLHSYRVVSSIGEIVACANQGEQCRHP
jgi:hypothetical protein